MSDTPLGRWVEVTFDCLPLRTVRAAPIPQDASPKLAMKLQNIQTAIQTHGTLGTYYLHNATCTFYLTNNPLVGMCQFSFEGVVLTDNNDMHSKSCELKIELCRDTCDWLQQSAVAWLTVAVQRAVLVEFDRYVQAGDLTKTIERLEALQKASDESGGFVGMYL
ncbi:MAG TPA: hypothetical protein DCF63_03300 [Planctomycetaceae bacterium]|nr:hypothetical protein [Planctomycetaceae bacterium]